jgi:hypothetical protein
MRAGLIPVIVIVTAVIGAGPSRSEEPRLADKTPDGAQLIDLYKAARTVADIEAANGKVKDQVLQAQSVASDLARLHMAKMTVCEDVDASRLDATAAKAKAFSIILARIDRELIRSLGAMRRKLAAERSASTRAKDDVNRFTVAAHEIGRLNLQAQELAKAIQSVARNIRTAAQSCMPTPIPPLFAEGSTPPSGVISARRSHPTRRKRPANAAVRRAPSIFRYY